MLVERYRSPDNRILIRAANKDSLTVFMHCSGGMLAVTTAKFKKEVWPLLKMHGVCWLETIDSVAKKKKIKTTGHVFKGSTQICKVCGHSEFYATKNNIECPGKMAW